MPEQTHQDIVRRIQTAVRPKNRQIVLVGLGRLQLGLIGPVFYSLGYELVGVNLGSDSVVKRIRQHEYYRVIDRPPHGGTDVPIRVVHHYDPGNPESPASKAAVSAASDAVIINTALGLNTPAIKAAADFVLAVERFRRANAVIDPLYVTCSDNPIGATFGIDYILREVQAASFRLPGDERKAVWNDMASHVRFLPCLADRICSARIVDELNPMKPVHVLTETFGEIALGRSFLCVHPLMAKTTDALGEIRIWDNLEIARQRKLYTVSMAHAITAYLGAFDPGRPKTIGEALQSRSVLVHVERALETVANAMAVQTGEAVNEWYEYASSALCRISNKHLDDPIPRVARDVERKLNRSDRLVGPLLLALRANYEISESLLNAVLHALLYAFYYGKQISAYEEDKGTLRVGELLRNHGPTFVLQHVSQLDPADPSEQTVMEAVSGAFERVVKSEPPP